MNVYLPVSLVIFGESALLHNPGISSFSCIDMTSRTVVVLAVKDEDPISILTGKCPITFSTFSFFSGAFGSLVYLYCGSPIVLIMLLFAGSNSSAEFFPNGRSNYHR